MVILRRHMALIGYLVLAAGVIGAFVFIEVARRERIGQLNKINYNQCVSIENLKRGEREGARESYRNLDRNGKLLGIKITPELRKQALEDRNTKLARFRELPCDRKLLE
jgi:hypothetical protein